MKTHGLWRATAATHDLQITLPIVSVPYDEASSVASTALADERSNLISHGLSDCLAEQIVHTADKIRRTGSNLCNLHVLLAFFGGAGVLPVDEEFATLRRPLDGCFTESGAPTPNRPERCPSPFDEQIEAVFDGRPAVLSFDYRVPAGRSWNVAASSASSPSVRRRPKRPCPSTPRGVEGNCATGVEAADGRVSVLRATEDSMVGFALVSRVDAVSAPVTAAASSTVVGWSRHSRSVRMQPRSARRFSRPAGPRPPPRAGRR